VGAVELRWFRPYTYDDTRRGKDANFAILLRGIRFAGFDGAFGHFDDRESFAVGERDGERVHRNVAFERVEWDAGEG